MKTFLSKSKIPGMPPAPDVLIFFRIPKTAGNTIDGVFEHCFPDEHFHAHVGVTDSALLVRSTQKIAEKFRRLPIEKQRSVRCLIGIHVAMDVDTIFDRPSKFFTVVRHPVDRVISNFFHNRTQAHLPSYPFIKDMTLEQYLESGIGLDAHNHQVRMLSGDPELDVPWDPDGRPIRVPPVKREHLEAAIRNIEERFLIAAPLEELAALVYFFKELYDWPLRRVFFQNRNQTPGRPAVKDVSEATLRKIADWNRYDAELYEWVQSCFAAQIEALGPEFIRRVRQFERLNDLVQTVDRFSPNSVREFGKALLFRSAVPSVG